jgi:hypothetical protein
MDLSQSIHSLVETNGTTANHICQEALGCKSLLMKEGRTQSIWKKMHLYLSKVGKMNLLSLATLNMNSCVVQISAWTSWNSALTIWKSSLIHKPKCSRPFWSDYHQLRGHHLQYHMGSSSEQLHSLAEDIKLSAHERHPTVYPFISCCFCFTFILCIVFLFSSIIIVLCF